MNREIQLIKNKERLGDILFETGLIIELLIMMTDAASWTLPYRGRLTQVAFGLFILKILMTRYNARQVIIGAAAAVIGVASYMTCSEEYIIRAVIFVIAAIGIDIELTLKIIFYGVLASAIVIIGMSLAGLGGEIRDIRDYGRDGAIEIRYCLGFNHANNLHSMLWYLTALLILRLKDRLNVWHFCIMAALSVGLFVLTRSRTGLLTTLSVIVLSVLFRYLSVKRGESTGIGDADTENAVSAGKRPANVLDVVTMAASISALVASLAITVRAAMEFPYLNDTMEKLDKLLTGRIEMVWEHTPLYAWRAFPDWQAAELVDDGFAVIGYSYGYVVLGLLTAVIIYLAVRFFEKRDGYGQIILMSVIMMIFMESTFIFNVSLICNMLLILCMCSAAREKSIRDRA